MISSKNISPYLNKLNDTNTKTSYIKIKESILMNIFPKYFLLFNQVSYRYFENEILNINKNTLRIKSCPSILYSHIKTFIIFFNFIVE